MLQRLPRFFSSHTRLASLLLGLCVTAGALALFRADLERSVWDRNESFLRLIEYKARDLCFQIRGDLPPPEDIAVVTIDETSVEAIGRFPWPRRIMAELVDRIVAQQPRVVAFDIMFTEPEAEEERRELDAILEALPPATAPETAREGLLRFRERIDGDRALARSLVHARAAGVRGVVLPVYFIGADSQGRFDGRKQRRDSRSELALKGNSAILLERHPEQLENLGAFAHQARGIVANIDDFAAIARSTDGELLAYQASVDNIVDQDGVLRREYMITEYPAGLLRRMESGRTVRTGTAKGELYVPLSVMAYALYAGWDPQSDIAVDYEGALVFERTARPDVAFGDGFFSDEAEPAAPYWETPAPLEPPAPLTVPLSRRGQSHFWYYGHHFPVDPEAWRRAQGRRTVFPYYSAVDLLQGNEAEVPPGALTNKIVLVGNTDVGHGDVKPCPFGDRFPGVEKHATLCANLLDRTMLRDADDLGSANLWILAGAGLLAALLTVFLHVGLSAPLVLALAAGYLSFAYHRFAEAHTWYSMVYPVLTLAVVFAVVTAARLVGEQAAGAQLKHAFQNFVDPHVVNQIITQGREVRLGGQDMEATIFFSDIANFTTISEMLEPEPLLRQLNEYLTAVTNALLQRGAFIDKYIGDAVMAAFGVPLPSQTAVQDACYASLEAQRVIGELNRAFEASGRPAFPTRIGLNTGVVQAGIMGSKLRANYSLIGDEVNLASRIEGINKVYLTHIAIGENTRDRLDDTWLIRKLDIVRVKGKAKPVAVYELLGQRDLGIPPGMRKRVEAFEAALALYLARDFARAREAFARLAEEHVEEGTALVYARRCATLLAEPPPPDWDGVYELKTK